MSADDNDHDELEDTDDVRDRIEQEADRAVEQFDEGIVDLLAWVLDTETRARIYVHLRQQPESTSEEIAEGTGLYPSTVREALAALTEEEIVTRQKRESDGAGNNPYEYSAISPSDLVNTIVGDIQSELNTVFNLDDHIGGETTLEPDNEPVTISVEDANDDATDADASEATGDDGDESEDGNDDADV
ncbi:putative transcriptional regulator [Haloarcula quadrata]|jgi:predicted transcriptional regulator|uniref:ArsR family transcriptional regulator n=4 Tax=Haloarcula TaxID=2237 RepID=Q5V3Q4_HALMA|nr:MULTISPECIES: winged helix-turn-helix domain-containing protein [Haloarcula]AAV45848.1 transcription regulator [Haloarcula marismortui ATCC 43049]EMA11972.1 transcription regulator [Haloarcula californiae ATCC 33799]EMA13555.1 transcription regulator [Haloarcula sinaiiensis ATCC 33800]NHN62075.1 winged helix-turn-helix transcriptional regulator [Haloarcula sp. JP-Z28]QCP90621.1 ArsR family transcriptional regulator [Haloarcula marismortui ATCC 43049]